MNEPTVPSSLPGRQPITTASIVRTRLIFTIPVRSPGRYGASSSFAITPSAPCSHSCAPSGSTDGRRQVDRLVDERLQRARGARACGSVEQHLVAVGEHVEGDEARRRLLGEHLDPRLGRVDALAERVEVLAAVLVEQDDLAVEHVAAGRERELGEVARAAACRCATAGRRRRRRRTRSSGSRPTWARSSSRRRSGSVFAERASWGSTGGASGSVMPPGNQKSPRGRQGLDRDGEEGEEAGSRRAAGARRSRAGPRRRTSARPPPRGVRMTSENDHALSIGPCDAIAVYLID